MGWTTDIPATTEVVYGFDRNKYIYNVTDKSLTTAHSAIITSTNSAQLVPGTTIYLRIKALDSAGHLTTSEERSSHLLGLNVKIRVVDESDKPIADSVVTLRAEEIGSDTQEAKTDHNGVAVFNNTSPGKHLVVLNDSQHGVEVKLAANTPDQSYQVKFSNQALANQTPILITIGSFGVLALVVAFFLLRRRSISVAPSSPVMNDQIRPTTQQPQAQSQNPYQSPPTQG